MLIETKHGHKVELKDELSARDHMNMRQTLAAKSKLRSVDGKTVPEIEGSVLMELESEAIKKRLVALDGSTENVYERMLDILVASEMDQIIETINRKEADEGKE